MGKVLVDKLLRVTEVGQIYMLMRVKKGKNPKDRLVDTFNNPVSESSYSYHASKNILDDGLNDCHGRSWHVVISFNFSSAALRHAQEANEYRDNDKQN